ncbi:MAG: hypothetical protein V7647_2356 [Acidobacteriota bacterium]
MKIPAALTPLQLAAIAFGAIVLGHALEMRDGFYDPVALRWALLAAVCVLAGTARVGVGRWRGSESMLAGVLVAGLVSGLLALATQPVGMYLVHPEPARHPWFLAGLAGATVSIVLIAWDPARARSTWFPALLVTYGSLGVWLIHASPRPHIDVMTVFREALNAVGELKSPYSITFPNIYDNTALYGEGLVVNGRVQFGFPYPPLSLLMAAPAYALHGDVRYAELAALLAGAAFIGSSARGRVAPLAAAGLLFTPRTFFVLEQAWTESLVICWAGLTVWAAARARAPERSPGPNGAAMRGVALGLLLAVKQHLAIALLLAGWLRRSDESGRTTWRLLIVAAAVAVGVTLPFVIWDPGGVWRSVVILQVREPFRADSLSVLSYFASNGWQPTPRVLLAAPLGALSAGLAVGWWRLPRTAAGFAVGLGVSFLLLFLFSKKAFCNYYFLVIALLMAGVAAGSAELSSEDREG